MRIKIDAFAVTATWLLIGTAAFAQATPPAGDMQPPPAAVATPAPAAPAAQSTPPASASAPADDGGSDTDARGGRRAARRELVDGCRQTERSQGTKGPARRADIIACVKAKDPKAAASMVCKDQGRAKGLTGDALKQFARKCRR